MVIPLDIISIEQSKVYFEKYFIVFKEISSSFVGVWIS